MTVSDSNAINDTSCPSVVIEPLTADRFADYGEVLGLPMKLTQEPNAFSFEASDFWHSADFDPGNGGQTEVLWVNYRDTSLTVSSLEAHWLTEQAIAPLSGGALVHVVCTGLSDTRQPDMSQLRAFRVAPGQGIKMFPGCWHTSFVADADQVTCLMLTRRSTTRDLVRHLRGDDEAAESTICQVASVSLANG
jgi:ureidoglycolate lyase